MSRQPDNQQRQKKSQTERYSEAKPINDRLAAILLAVGGACSLVATWGGIDNHHTTMTVAIIVGVLCFALASYFHWTPGKGPHENMQPVASLPALVNAMRTIPPTPVESKTEPKLDPPPRRVIPQMIPVVDPKIVSKRPRFDPSSYTETVVLGVHWQWEYNLLEPNMPRRLRAFCVECGEGLLPLSGGPGTTSPLTVLACHNPLCIACYRKINISGDLGDAYASARKQIIEQIAKMEDEWNNKPVRTIPFPSGPPRWAEYTQDMFDGVIWRWHYKLEFDNAPRDVQPYCAECEAPLIIGKPHKVDAVRYTGKPGWMVLMYCRMHPAPHITSIQNPGDYVHIKTLIKQKLDDGTWDEAVTRQRMARGW